MCPISRPSRFNYALDTKLPMRLMVFHLYHFQHICKQGLQWLYLWNLGYLALHFPLQWPQMSVLESQHYNDVIMGTMASQITSLTIVYSTFYIDLRKHQSSASLAIVRGIHRWPVNTPHKGPITQKMFVFDDVIILRCEFYIKISLGNAVKSTESIGFK